MIVRFALVVALLGALPAGAEPIKSWRFQVYLNDTAIGTHQFDLFQRGAERELVSRARFDVKLLFVTAYRYRHEAAERWRGDCLAAIEARTDDNGDLVRVRTEAQAAAFRVLINDAPGPAATGCVKSFAYWNPAFLQERRLLHPQTGQLVDVTIRRLGSETLHVAGTRIDAARYALRADGLAIDLWYSPEGEWLALESPLENGRTLRYRLEAWPGRNANTVTAAH